MIRREGKVRGILYYKDSPRCYFEALREADAAFRILQGEGLSLMGAVKNCHSAFLGDSTRYAERRNMGTRSVRGARQPGFLLLERLLSSHGRDHKGRSAENDNGAIESGHLVKTIFAKGARPAAPYRGLP